MTLMRKYEEKLCQSKLKKGYSYLPMFGSAYNYEANKMLALMAFSTGTAKWMHRELAAWIAFESAVISIPTLPELGEFYKEIKDMLFKARRDPKEIINCRFLSRCLMHDKFSTLREMDSHETWDKIKALESIESIQWYYDKIEAQIETAKDEEEEYLYRWFLLHKKFDVLFDAEVEESSEATK